MNNRFTNDMATLTKQAQAVQVQRLSERTPKQLDRLIRMAPRRCDSPNPREIRRAIQLWKENKTWKEIAEIIDCPPRTMRRYLLELGYKRDYAFVSMKMKEHVRTPEHCAKISKTRIERGVAKGPKNSNWNGGIKNTKIQVWNTSEYKVWREAIFKRDDYICKGCGARNKKGVGKTIQMEAHHILPRRDFPHLTFDISNGIALCKACHDKTRRKEYLSVNIWKQRVA